MICNNCKNPIPEGCNFCENCGAKVEAVLENPVPPVAPQPQPVIINNVNVEQRKPISTGGWIGRGLINYIPFVGPIIYFIMLFVWANDKTKEVSFNTWAKSQLLLMLIALIPAIILVFWFIMIFAAVESGGGVFAIRF